ncbi:hypothetical protein [Lentzea sp. CA-135723]|uniref:hypothetical protein n=1 Tax=Lentzea sp. CA-135723 TaxID=3239950 RepID=UPI003D8B103F
MRGHDNHGRALGEIELVRRVATTMNYTVVHAERGLWWWRLGSLAKSAQGFARRVDAELAAGRFRRRAGQAGNDPELAVFSPGRRRGARGGGQSDVWPQRPVG